MAKEALEALSHVILSLFFVQNCLLLIILGVRKFFSNPMYCLDFTVVGVSLGIGFWYKSGSSVDAVHLIIIGRLWRFVSLAYDLLSMAYEQDQETIKSLKEKISELEYKLLE